MYNYYIKKLHIVKVFIQNFSFKKVNKSQSLCTLNLNPLFIYIPLIQNSNFQIFTFPIYLFTYILFPQTDRKVVHLCKHQLQTKYFYGHLFSVCFKKQRFHVKLKLVFPDCCFPIDLILICQSIRKPGHFQVS